MPLNVQYKLMETMIQSEQVQFMSHFSYIFGVPQDMALFWLLTRLTVQLGAYVYLVHLCSLFKIKSGYKVHIELVSSVSHCEDLAISYQCCICIKYLYDTPFWNYVLFINSSNKQHVCNFQQNSLALQMKVYFS